MKVRKKVKQAAIVVSYTLDNPRLLEQSDAR